MLKYLAAILILSGLFLPLSSCQRYVTPGGHTVEYVDASGKPVVPNRYPPPENATPIKEIAKRGALPPDLKAVRDYHYFLSGFEARRFSSWLCVITLAWPLAMLLILHAFRGHPRSKWAYFLAPPLLFWSGYLLQAFAMLFGGRYEVGYWTTLLGIVLFGFESARECLSILSGIGSPIKPATRYSLVCMITLLGPLYPLYHLIWHR